MNKTINIVFIEDYMDKLLKEIKLPISSILENYKIVRDYSLCREVTNSSDDKESFRNLKEEEYESDRKLLLSKIGKYDYDTISIMNRELHKIIFNNDLDLWKNFIDSKSIYGDLEDATIALNKLTLDIDIPDFKDTYIIELNVKGNFIVKVKPGFTNYISKHGSGNYKKVLLGEIINLIDKDSLFSLENFTLSKTYSDLL